MKLGQSERNIDKHLLRIVRSCANFFSWTESQGMCKWQRLQNDKFQSEILTAFGGTLPLITCSNTKDDGEKPRKWLKLDYVRRKFKDPVNVIIPVDRVTKRTRSIVGVKDETGTSEGKGWDVKTKVIGWPETEGIGLKEESTSRAFIRSVRISSNFIYQRILSKKTRVWTWECPQVVEES